MSPKIPTELAYARTAAKIAWDKYDAALGTPFQAELWKVVNWMEERASRIYRDWQAVGGTSDIDSITAAEIANDNNWLGMFETLDAIGAEREGTKAAEISNWLGSDLDTNPDAKKYDFTPFPADMPAINMDNIEEIPL